MSRVKSSSAIIRYNCGEQYDWRLNKEIPGLPGPLSALILPRSGKFDGWQTNNPIIFVNFAEEMKTPDDFFIPDNEVRLPDELDYSRVDEIPYGTHSTLTLLLYCLESATASGVIKSTGYGVTPRKTSQAEQNKQQIFHARMGLPAKVGSPLLQLNKIRMKHLITIILFALFAIPADIMAQSWNFGIETGYVSNTPDVSEYYATARSGFKFSLDAGYQFDNKICLESGLPYIRKGATTSGTRLLGTEINSIKFAEMDYLQLPVMIGYKLNIRNNFSIKPSVGGYYAVGVAGYALTDGIDAFNQPYTLL